MIKKYCDVCNKEVDSLTEYTLPKSENIFAEDKFGTKLAIAGQTCNPVKKELCPRCALYLAKFIDQYLLPISDENSEYALALFKKSGLFADDTKESFSINILLPCPVGSVILNKKNEKMYVITSYRIGGIGHALANCVEKTPNKTRDRVFIGIKNGSFSEDIKILEIPDSSCDLGEYLIEQ